jgi:integrase
MSLTDRAVRNLRATDKEVFISDGDGLYIRVRPTGSKTWVRRSQIGGKSKKLTLGEYPTMGLADARTTCLAVAARGAFLQKDVCSAYTDWIAALRKIRKAPEQVEARMQLHFLPYFGDRPVDELTRAELVDRLKLIAAKAPVQANRSLAEVKQFLDYCAESGWVKQSVLAGVTTRVAGGKEKTRDRTLDDAELTALLSILQHNWNPYTNKVTGFDAATRLALTLALLTGQRSNEVRSITKAQVKGRTWTIPKHITKTDVDMKVYLPAIASRIVKLAITLLGVAPFKGMERQTLSHAARYMKFSTPFTPHDLRRTMRTRMADMGVLPHIGEKCLNHKLGGVWAIYDRAEYADEKRAAWRKWARYLLQRANEKKPPVREA